MGIGLWERGRFLYIKHLVERWGSFLFIENVEFGNGEGVFGG